MARNLQIGDFVHIIEKRESFLFPITQISDNVSYAIDENGFGQIQLTGENTGIVIGHPEATFRFVSREIAGTVSLAEFPTSIKITDPEFGKFRQFLQDPEVMVTLRDGNIWSDQKIQRYLSYFNQPENSEFMDREIIYSGELVGIVGIRRDFELLGPSFKGWPFVWIVVDRRYWGKGIGKAALKMAVDLYIQKYPQFAQIFSLVASDNVGSLKIHLDNGFNLYQTTNLHGKPHQLLLYSRT